MQGKGKQNKGDPSPTRLPDVLSQGAATRPQQQDRNTDDQEAVTVLFLL